MLLQNCQCRPATCPIRFSLLIAGQRDTTLYADYTLGMSAAAVGLTTMSGSEFYVVYASMLASQDDENINMAVDFYLFLFP
jgi:hypothetical protein